MYSNGHKKIVIGITGGIAAYKSLSLIRLFRSHQCEVKVVATQNALQFVTVLSIETLSNNKLYYDTFEANTEREVSHISLSEWADCVIIAPATANIIGKYAHGIADDALSTLLLATQKPVFLAPSMNEKMYLHPAVRQNCDILRTRGCRFIEPASGFLACGTEGIGRMETPEVIFAGVMQSLETGNRFAGKKILITAGPTYEPIDPVRFIGNHSSGKMGFSLACELAAQGAAVTLLTGPTPLTVLHPSVQRIDVTTAAQMFDRCKQIAPSMDVVIMAAAVADYSPQTVATEKIKKSDDNLVLQLHKTEDILSYLGHHKPNGQLLVGFALETENELENAKLKLHNKKADIIVLNSLNVPGAGFSTDTNKITMLTKNGEVLEGELKTKKMVAQDIIDRIFSLL